MVLANAAKAEVMLFADELKNTLSFSDTLTPNVRECTSCTLFHEITVKFYSTQHFDVSE
ncbi:hypothetical protein PB1_11904 [Bacillus methanolicus PB1]|uniref:Uncharacterized protein n=1 Tax=Bacillus methanolicus PB1 TaxID=997296 RepID=I3DVJ2_BACMT|nr:hypothetical protein [Bacillus methanolicus]EIJ78263.1 hypothetical protein PB1_11904 [Bacillus methanolicus PB1]